MAALRSYHFLDHVIEQADHILRTLSDHYPPAGRANPAENCVEPLLSREESKHSAGLIRVDHAGEVCAQALYQGQSLTARHVDLQQELQQAAREENDHLVWCSERLQELQSHPSYLNPLWYMGALSLGMLAGALGDKINLGFLAETERQVTKHLESHLRLLPEKDEKSRQLLTQMRADEMQHATMAVHQGAAELPTPVKFLMRAMAKVMTRLAYWI